MYVLYAIDICRGRDEGYKERLGRENVCVKLHRQRDGERD